MKIPVSQSLCSMVARRGLFAWLGTEAYFSIKNIVCASRHPPTPKRPELSDQRPRRGGLESWICRFERWDPFPPCKSAWICRFERWDPFPPFKSAWICRFERWDPFPRGSWGGLGGPLEPLGGGPGSPLAILRGEACKGGRP